MYWTTWFDTIWSPDFVVVVVVVVVVVRLVRGLCSGRRGPVSLDSRTRGRRDVATTCGRFDSRLRRGETIALRGTKPTEDWRVPKKIIIEVVELTKPVRKALDGVLCDG